jgi:hypothetical protein
MPASDCWDTNRTMTRAIATKAVPLVDPIRRREVKRSGTRGSVVCMENVRFGLTDSFL